MTAIVDATITWLHSFAIWPEPSGPIRVQRCEYAATIGRMRSTSAGSPPAMTASVPARVPATPPDTGASTQPIPLASCRRAASSRVAPGRMLEWSTNSDPCPPAAAMPSAPKSTASTACASETQAKTTAASAATSAGEPAPRAPAATTASSLRGERFHATTGRPAARSRSTIAVPISPSPTNPTTAGAAVSSMRPQGTCGAMARPGRAADIGVGRLDSVTKGPTRAAASDRDSRACASPSSRRPGCPSRRPRTGGPSWCSTSSRGGW